MNFTYTYSSSHTYAAGGNYTIKARLYHQGAPGNDNQADAVATAVVCVTPVPTTGGLVVTKNTIGGNGTFAFTGGAGSFSITTSGNTGTKSISGIAAGTISVTETAQTGWAKTGDTCQNVTITAGATSTCTITNTKAGGITIIKNVVTTGGGTAVAGDFAITVKDGSNVTIGTAAGSTSGTSYYNVAPGTYTVSEPANAHYTATYSGACSGTNSFSVSSGATSTCTITNTYHNAAPVADNGSGTTNEDVALNAMMTGSDADLDTFLFAIVTNPVSGMLSGVNNSTGAFTYTPNANFNGSDSFTFQVTDSQGATSNVATFSITVNPMNDNPNAVDDSANVNEDSSTTTINVLVNDTAAPDSGETLSITNVTGGTQGGTTAINGTQVDYMPAPGFVGQDTFTYTISDGNGGTDTATVTVTVSNTADAPMATGDSYTTNEDTTLTVAAPGVLGNDTDADTGTTLHAVKVTDPSHGSVTLGDDGSVSYVPAANYCGEDSFTYKANDGALDSSTVTVSITVTCINDAPDAQDQSLSTPQNTSISGVATATDAEGNTLTFATTSNPTHGTLTFGSTGAFTYVPAFAYIGLDSFTFKANDGTTDSDTGTVSITVTPVQENTYEKCTDGIDNDGDAVVLEKILLDVVDSGTGGIDLADSDCADFLPKLVIVKHAINADGTFTFYYGNESHVSVTTEEGTGQSQPIVLGNVSSDSVSENVPEGWSFTDGECEVTNQYSEVGDASAGFDGPTAYLSDLGAGDVVTCTFTNTIDPTNADISVVKTVDNNNPNAGGTIVYTLTVHNDGPSTATGVVVSDNLPSSVTYVSDDGAGMYSTSTGLWTIGTLASGNNAVLHITVTVKQSADHTMFFNEASVSEVNDDTNTSNNTSSVGVTVGQQNGGGGGGGGANGPIAGGGPIIGQVLGASTTLPELPAGCVALLDTYMRQLNKKNNAEDVKDLQTFLNKEMNAGLPVNGVFGPMTDKWVRAFQQKYAAQTLTPWGLTGPTGFVYKTTQRWINLIHCSTLDIPMPVNLTPYQHEDER